MPLWSLVAPKHGVVLPFAFPPFAPNAVIKRPSRDQWWSSSDQGVVNQCSSSVQAVLDFWRTSKVLVLPQQTNRGSWVHNLFLDNIGNESNTANVWCFEDYCFWTASKFQYKKLNCLREEWVRTMLLPNEWNNLWQCVLQVFASFAKEYVLRLF